MLQNFGRCLSTLAVATSALVVLSAGAAHAQWNSDARSWFDVPPSGPAAARPAVVAGRAVPAQACVNAEDVKKVGCFLSEEQRADYKNSCVSPSGASKADAASAKCLATAAHTGICCSEH
jgi:hypothetical protein